MSTKKPRTRCPKCYRRMSKPSDYEWFGHVRGQVLTGKKTGYKGIDYVEVDGHIEAWQAVCLQCVREHFADPLLHMRPHKRESFRRRQETLGLRFTPRDPMYSAPPRSAGPPMEQKPWKYRENGGKR